MTRRIHAALFATATLLAGYAPPPAAQDYPSKPVHMVVPWPAGGLVDIAARIAAKELQAGMGQPVVVDNKPGAGGVIGADIVAKSAPDGYTLVLTTSALTMNAALDRKLPFNVSADFVPIAAFAYAPSVLVVHPSAGIGSVADLVSRAKARPGKLTYASAGTGSPAHLSGELLKTMAGIDLLHVPYKGAPQAITDLMAGRVDTQFANATVALPQIKAGTVRPLAVTSARRFAALPDVPTLAEAGLPNFEADQWLGILVPAGTPAKVQQRLRAETDKALAKEEVRAALAQSGMTVARAATLPEFAAYIKQDLDKWAQVVKAANIKQD